MTNAPHVQLINILKQKSCLKRSETLPCKTCGFIHFLGDCVLVDVEPPVAYYEAPRIGRNSDVRLRVDSREGYENHQFRVSSGNGDTRKSDGQPVEPAEYNQDPFTLAKGRAWACHKANALAFEMGHVDEHCWKSIVFWDTGGWCYIFHEHPKPLKKRELEGSSSHTMNDHATHINRWAAIRELHHVWDMYEHFGDVPLDHDVGEILEYPMPTDCAVPAAPAIQNPKPRSEEPGYVFVEFCCSSDSLLCSDQYADMCGCATERVRLTEEHDMTTPAGLEHARQAIRRCPKKTVCGAVCPVLLGQPGRK